jgi:hypothetical protein
MQQQMQGVMGQGGAIYQDNYGGMRNSNGMQYGSVAQQQQPPQRRYLNPNEVVAASPYDQQSAYSGGGGGPINFGQNGLMQGSTSFSHQVNRTSQQ